MKQDYITTNIQIPRAWHKEFKRQAMEGDKSLGELLRGFMQPHAIVFQDVKRKHHGNGFMGELRDIIMNKQEAVQARRKRHVPQKVRFLSDLAKYAQPFGADVSSRVDDIVYGEDFN